MPVATGTGWFYVSRDSASLRTDKQGFVGEPPRAIAAAHEHRSLGAIDPSPQSPTLRFLYFHVRCDDFLPHKSEGKKSMLQGYYAIFEVVLFDLKNVAYR